MVDQSAAAAPAGGWALARSQQFLLPGTPASLELAVTKALLGRGEGSGLWNCVLWIGFNGQFYFCTRLQSDLPTLLVS